MTLPPVKVAARKRVRMKPEVRSRLILEAALAEFSQRGFDATRIEDIANRAGLTKTGVYGHFDSKIAIFEAMLSDVLMTPGNDLRFGWDTEAYDSLESMVDSYLEHVYNKVQEPAFTERVPSAAHRGNTLAGMAGPVVQKSCA